MAPPPQSIRKGRSLLHLLLTLVLFLSCELLLPFSLSIDPADAMVVDCRRVVFHPYCRGISARRASYTAEQMKGLNNPQEADQLLEPGMQPPPQLVVHQDGLHLNPFGKQPEQQEQYSTIINHEGQPLLPQKPDPITQMLLRGKVDNQQQQQNSQLETDDHQPLESISLGRQQTSSASARMDPYYRHQYSHPRSYSHSRHPSFSSYSSPVNLYSLLQKEDRILNGGGHHRQYHHPSQYYHQRQRQYPHHNRHNTPRHRAPRHRNPFTPLAPYDLDYFPYYKRAAML